MRKTWALATAGLMLCGLAGTAQAQKSGGIAFIPFAGYALPGTLAEDNTNDIHFKSNGALLLGLQLELGLSKSLGIDVGVNRTISQTFDIESGGASQGQEDQTMTQITGSLVIRPGGRRANGAVTPLMIELGGGVTMYSLGSPSAGLSDFNSTQPMGFAGLGYNFPIGPRSTVQLFGRAQMINSYSSAGLDAFNAAPPPTQVEGKMMLNLQFGVGLRVGR